MRSPAQQVRDLATLGLDFDGEVVWQSARLDAYAAAVAQLDTYECYCTRKRDRGRTLCAAR